MFILLFKRLFSLIMKKYSKNKQLKEMIQKNKKAKYEVGIIAAGEGARLKSEGIKTSKPMVPILGKPLIKIIIDAARNSGANKINCIINEQSKDLESYIRNYDKANDINVLVKTTESSFHSLKEISQYLSPPFLIATADSIFKADEFKHFIEFGLNESGADVIVAATDFKDDESPLYINIDEEGRVTGFDDVANNFSYVTGGMYLFRKKINKEIEDAMRSNIKRLRNFLRFLVKKEFYFQIFPFSRIIDVDHRSDITKAEEYLGMEQGQDT